MFYQSLVAKMRFFRAFKLACLQFRIPVRRSAAIFLLFLGIRVFSAGNDFIIADNEPFWCVYQLFEGYHADFDKFEGIFLKELSKQGLDGLLTGKPFNLYLSEREWAIACRIKNKADLTYPLKIHYCRNLKLCQTVYQGEDHNIPLVLELASSFIQNNNYYWDGYLIINKLTDDRPGPVYKLQIPVSRDYYNIFIKPYGIARIVITFLCLLFAIFLFGYKQGRVVSNHILGIFMLCYVLLNLSAFQWIFNIYEKWPHLYNFAVSLNFLTGPLLFFYSLSVINEKFRFKKVLILHLLPFLAVAILYLVLYQVHDTETKIRLLNNRFRESLFFELVYIGGRIQFVSYLLISLYFVFHSSQNVNQNLLRTLRFLLIALLSLIVVDSIKNEIPVQMKFHYIIKAAGILAYLAMISILILRGLMYPEMFSYNVKNGNGQKDKAGLLPCRI